MYVSQYLKTNFTIITEIFRIYMGLTVRGLKPRGERNFFFFTFVQTGSGTRSASSTIGMGSLSRGKMAGTWIEHAYPSGAEIKNQESYTSTQHICLYPY
jgi:hypothetical protein